MKTLNNSRLKHTRTKYKIDVICILASIPLVTIIYIRYHIKIDRIELSNWYSDLIIILLIVLVYSVDPVNIFVSICEYQ